MAFGNLSFLHNKATFKQKKTTDLLNCFTFFRSSTFVVLAFEKILHEGIAWGQTFYFDLAQNICQELATLNALLYTMCLYKIM
jgi:hypothetical protein